MQPKKRIIAGISLALLVSIGTIGYLQYPKLAIISGYAAKNMASNAFLAGRNPDSIRANDLQVPLISLASVSIEKDSAATASVFGLQTKKAIYREGLGAALIREGKTASRNFLKPDRKQEARPLPYPEGNGEALDTVFPEVDYQKLTIAINQAFSDPEKQRTRSLLLLYKGYLLAEQYEGDIDATTPVLGWSMTKSVLATLYGILQYENKLNLSSAADLEAWQQDDRRNITYNMLLRMQSSLAWDEDYSEISDVTRMLFLSDDMAAVQAEKKLAGTPGSIWNYSSGTTNLLSGLLKKQFDAQQEYLNFPYASLIDRIGMYSMLLEADLSGTFVGSSYGWASTRDWGKFGLLYLRKGDWFGDQLFDPAWTDYVSQPTQGSNGRYGAHFWLNRNGAYPSAPADLYSANGYQGQHVFIIPSKDLVVVRTGLAEEPDFDADAFFAALMLAFQ
ncbi:serine hydrolase domain-containing protein [Robiginitalea sp. IMCC44478]|uniref:serine hydrolase domain-containing protein n=1 Tax=Robiginitalea sp. IMCC44478 TaxID=3459122 RepID=UPI0040434FB2